MIEVSILQVCVETYTTMRCGIALLDTELYVQGGKFGLQINFICDGSKATKNVYQATGILS